MLLTLSGALWLSGMGGRAAWPSLCDKTLVAWLHLANTQQQGGAVLTVMEGEDFDALVFGERKSARWMAGSDFFRRTPSVEAQADTAAETAGPNEAVQMAVVYAGKQITLYRNGSKYADYRVEEPRVFDDDWFALLGLRYLGANGPIGFLEADVEEARLYDVALDGAALSSLKPNVRSGPRPLAQWTFEGGSTADAMGLFPPLVLEGGAAIVDGRLRLNGRTAYAVARHPTPALPQTMFYKARTTGNMWDTWLYHHRGTNYLFHLAGPFGQWQGIAMATSVDGVHWDERGLVLRKGEGVTWLGTGATWASPNYARDGKFFLNFSEWRGNGQTIFFAESTNLLEWKRLGAEFEFKQDPRWYQVGLGNDSRWDCIYPVPRVGGGFYGYWTANPKGSVGFGFGETLDGVTWRALAPPKLEWGGVTPPGGCEAGAVEKIGARYYMMLGTTIHGENGMFTMVADQPQGPFRAAQKNLALLTSRGHGNTYFARFFPHPDGLLVNHHSIARNSEVSMGMMKRALVDEAGTLRLGWWRGNEKIKVEAVKVQRVRGVGVGERLEPVLDARRGFVVEGTVHLPKDASAAPVGLVLAQRGEQRTMMRVRAGGIVEIGLMPPDGRFVAENTLDRAWSFGATARFRLLVQGTLTEFYLDDLLIQCYSLPRRADGRVELSSSEAFEDVRAWHAAQKE